METIFNRLKSNYLFQASLGSKELFHSNLLAWLLEQKDINGKYIALQEFLKQFTDFNQTDFFDEVIIAREELNIDLTIKYKVENQWYLVFIENKMKSIPSINQLDEYDKKIGKLMPRYKSSNETIQKILLTPLTPRLINNLALKEFSWKSITYQKDILFFLKSLQHKSFELLEEVKLFLEKYIDMLECQMALLLSFNLDSAQEQVFLKMPYDFYAPNNKVIALTRELRLHDLILKIIHDQLGSQIERRLVKMGIFPRRVDTEFTNSTGITSVDLTIKDGLYIGIQLQGNQFRYYISGSNSSQNESLAVKLFQQKLWFYDIDLNIPLEGQGRRKDHFVKLGLIDENHTHRAFCEYNNGIFVYFYKRIDTMNQIPSVEFIIDLFVRSFERYNSHKQEILKLL